MALSSHYLELVNPLLAVNYYGEVLTVELLAKLVADRSLSRYRPLLTRQLLDETRHANATRRLMLDRGRDPSSEDSAADFTFGEMFRRFGGMGGEATLAFLGENEAISARHFAKIIRAGLGQGDAALVSLYAEILNDEVCHSTSILDALPQGDLALGRVREEARTMMKQSLNLPYARFFTAYPKGGAA